MIRRAVATLAATVVALAIPATASAVTQCKSKVERIFAGDGGHLYFFLKTGVAGVLTPRDPNRDAMLSMALTAQAQGREVILRFTADNVSCSTVAARFDFVGMYIEP